MSGQMRTSNNYSSSHNVQQVYRDAHRLLYSYSNPKNNKSYETEFVVIANNHFPPRLGSPSSQQMELQVKHENI